MGRFEYLKDGKSKEVKIGKETFKVKPLNLDSLGYFTDKNLSEADRAFNIVLKTLQQTDESITMDDVKELPIKVFNDVMEAVMEVNELT